MDLGLTSASRWPQSPGDHWSLKDGVEGSHYGQGKPWEKEGQGTDGVDTPCEGGSGLLGSQEEVAVLWRKGGAVLGMLNGSGGGEFVSLALWWL